MKAFVTHSDLGSGAIPSYEKVGKVSNESVLKHTGKGWKYWIAALEKAGARTWNYQEIVAFLKKKHRLTPWWQQGVALGFEIATGRRKEGQDARGKYMVTATKSLPHPVPAIWNMLTSPEGQAVWLKPLSDIQIVPKAQFETEDGFFGEIRTVARQRRIRLYWQDPLWEKHTVVEVVLVARPKKASILVFNHTGLATPKVQATLRIRWRTAADSISALFSRR